MSQVIAVNGPPNAFREDLGVRLVVPVPDCGWLRLGGNWGEPEGLAWRESAAAAARAVGLVAAQGRIHVVPEVRKGAGDRFHVGEDVRPSLDAALEGLVDAGVLKSSDWRHVGCQQLTIGASTGDCGALLVLKLLGVSGG